MTCIDIMGDFSYNVEGIESSFGEEMLEGLSVYFSDNARKLFHSSLEFSPAFILMEIS